MKTADKTTGSRFKGQPELRQKFREQLGREEPRLLAIFDLWDGKFDRAQTASGLRRFMQQNGFKWVPSHDTISRYLRRLAALEGEFFHKR